MSALIQLITLGQECNRILTFAKDIAFPFTGEQRH
jgi:hypothetical protein